jgi:hypothetical protein
MTTMTTQTQMEALASFLSSISSPPLHYTSDPSTKKPLPGMLSSDSGPTIQPFNLQKYHTISGPQQFLI